MGTRAPGPGLRANCRVGHRKKLALTHPARHQPKPDGIMRSYLPRLDGLDCANAEAATDLVLAEVRLSRSSADAFLATGRDVCFVFRVPMSLFTSCLDSLRHGYAFVKMNATRVKRPCKIEGT